MKTLSLLVISVAAMSALTTVERARAGMHQVDRDWLGERLMDTMTRVLSREDWSSAEALQSNQDYRWLESSTKPLLVAHALGESGLSEENTLQAMARSYQVGLRLFEVDVVLKDDELRCQHDFEPQRVIALGCTFDSLLGALPPDAWIVLDIKTDFASTGQRIVDQLKVSASASRVVFQLYRPSDFALFNSWQRQVHLPGPILTTYLAHRRIEYLVTYAQRIGVRAFTLPLYRLPALNQRPAGLMLFTHPIHDCSAWDMAKSWGMDGMYVRSSLRCESRPRLS